MHVKLGTSDGCPWLDSAVCKNGQQPLGAVLSRHKPWNFIGLAKRSTDILQSQVYAFSAERLAVKDPGCPQGNCLRIVRIEPDGLSFPDKLDGTLAKACADWLEEDRRLLKPLQFFPHYMRCMIDYGRDRAKQEGWAKL